MKKISKFIIILITILIILMLIILIMILKLKKINNDISPNENVSNTEIKNSIERVTIKNEFFTVKNVINQYFLALCELNKTEEDILIFEQDEGMENLNETIEKEKETVKKRIYSFFDENSIKEMALTTNNLQEKLGNYKDIEILIENMYVREITETLKFYYISGQIVEKDSLEKEKFNLVLALDDNNLTFNIYTYEYANKHQFDKTEVKIDITEIENRIYNKYNYEYINDEEYAKELLKSYTKSVMYDNIDYLYEKLDEEYKTNKFNGISEYEKYIEENRRNIITATLQSYKYNVYEDYVQYICIDQNENYYIFNENTVMNYNLILDLYTVDLPEFIDQYNTATNEEKVVLNVQKIEEALKDKDYEYLYNKLDTTFRSSKYPTEDDFQKYIQNNISKENTIEFVELIQEGKIYIYKAKIKSDGENIQERNFNIIMKLEDEMNFVYSFNIE